MKESSDRVQSGAEQAESAELEAPAPSIPTDERLVRLEEDVRSVEQGIERVQSSMDETKQGLARIEAALGITPSEETHSLASARDSLARLEADKARLEQELSPERQEALEKAREGRAKLLNKIFESRIASLGMNFVPGVDVAKLSFEAMRGRTLAGKDLAALHRVNYVLIAGGFALTYALLLAGQGELSATSYAAAGTLAKIEFSPQVLGEAVRIAEEKVPAAAPVIKACRQFMIKRKEEAQQVFARVKPFFSPDFPGSQGT